MGVGFIFEKPVYFGLKLLEVAGPGPHNLLEPFCRWEFP